VIVGTHDKAQIWNLLCHGTLEWLFLAYTTVRMFTTDCRNNGFEFTLQGIILYR